VKNPRTEEPLEVEDDSDVDQDMEEEVKSRQQDHQREK
jgi:hypothetical protein